MKKQEKGRDYDLKNINLEKLFEVMFYVSAHSGVTMAEVHEITGLSRSTLMRLVKRARSLGVILTFDRYAHEWSVESWGIFHEERCKKWWKKRRKK